MRPFKRNLHGLLYFCRNGSIGRRPAPVRGPGGDVLQLWLGNSLRRCLGPPWRSGSVSPAGLWIGCDGIGRSLLWTRLGDNLAGQSQVHWRRGFPAGVLPYTLECAQLWPLWRRWGYLHTVVISAEPHPSDPWEGSGHTNLGLVYIM